jgi:hypothetical protein
MPTCRPLESSFCRHLHHPPDSLCCPIAKETDNASNSTASGTTPSRPIIAQIERLIADGGPTQYRFRTQIRKEIA